METELPFERWVRISAALTATSIDDREPFLERWGFTESEWTAQELLWSRALAEDVAAGRTERASVYGRACLDARRSAGSAVKQAPTAGATAVSSPPDDAFADSGPPPDGDVTRLGGSIPNEPTLPFARRANPIDPAPLFRPAEPPDQRRSRSSPPREDRTEILRPSSDRGEPTLPFQPKRRDDR